MPPDTARGSFVGDSPQRRAGSPPGPGARARRRQASSSQLGADLAALPKQRPLSVPSWRAQLSRLSAKPAAAVFPDRPPGLRGEAGGNPERAAMEAAPGTVGADASQSFQNVWLK